MAEAEAVEKGGAEDDEELDDLDGDEEDADKEIKGQEEDEKTLREDLSKLGTGTNKGGAEIQKTETKNSKAKDVFDKVKTDSRLRKKEGPETREGVEIEILEETAEGKTSKGQNRFLLQRYKEDEDFSDNDDEEAPKDMANTSTLPDTSDSDSSSGSSHNSSESNQSDDGPPGLLHAGQVGADSGEETGAASDYNSKSGGSNDDYVKPPPLWRHSQRTPRQSGRWGTTFSTMVTSKKPSRSTRRQ